MKNMDMPWVGLNQQLASAATYSSGIWYFFSVPPLSPPAEVPDVQQSQASPLCLLQIPDPQKQRGIINYGVILSHYISGWYVTKHR